jgi:hypothetical protein
MTEEIKVIKRFKSFILGYCGCNCGNEIKIISSHYEKGFGHRLQRYKSGHNPIDYSKRILPTRAKHHNYKGGIKKMVGEYLGILRPHHKYAVQGYVLLHRYRMELMIGRYLTKEEVVHHIDGNPKNNEESNLMLFASHSEHITYEQTIDMTGRICKKCGSDKTLLKIRKNGKMHLEWYGNKEDGFVCYMCHFNLKKTKKILVSKLPNY